MSAAGEPRSAKEVPESYRHYQPRNALPLIREGIETITNPLTAGQTFTLAQVELLSSEVAVIQHYGLEAYDVDSFDPVSRIASFGKFGWSVANNGQINPEYFSSQVNGAPNVPIFGLGALRHRERGHGSPVLVFVGPGEINIHVQVINPAAGQVIPDNGWILHGEMRGWIFSPPVNTEFDKQQLCFQQIRDSIDRAMAWGGLPSPPTAGGP